MATKPKLAVETTPLKIAGRTKILLKFNFTNFKRIPPGIGERGRLSDFQLDTVHAEKAQAAGNSELGLLDRIRAGRVDTGTPCTPKNGSAFVQAAVLRRGLPVHGFKPVKVDYYIHHRDARPGSMDKAVVCLEYHQNVPGEKLAGETRTQLDSLSNMVWQFCHIWDNPDGSVTVNFVGCQPDNFNPKHAVRIVDGKLSVVEVAQKLTEAEEAESE